MRPVLLVVTLAAAACGDSAPTAAPCTRNDELAPCAQPSEATRVADEAWEVIVRATAEEQVEYLDGGVQCALTRRTCVVEECSYVRSPDVPPPEGWVLVVEDVPHYQGYGEDTEAAAIVACTEHHGLDE